MPVDTREPSRNYKIPDPANTIAEDFARLVDALTAIGVDVAGLLSSVAGKANTSHTHVIGNITGLQTALDGKAAVSHTHTLDELSDVVAAGATNGQVLIFVGSQWQPGSLAIASVSGLQAALDAKAASSDALALAIALG